MSCDVVRLADGSTALLCRSRRKTMFCWECGHIAERLCDFLVEGGKTCDRALCREHGSHEGTNLDFCSTHGQPVLGL